jgi:hypothetical protein
VTQWLYQIRIKVSKKLSAALRSAVDQAEAKKLHVIAQRHGTRMVCTFDGFSDYCREAELNNTEDYPLYDWTITITRFSGWAWASPNPVRAAPPIAPQR